MTGISMPTAMDALSDVRLAANGDEIAFARLIGRHSPAMSRVSYVIAGDWDTAQEAVQSAWTIAWRKLPAIRDQERLEPWLVSIAANQTRTILRRHHRRTTVEISVGPGRSREHDPADAIELLDLRNALNRLAVEDRALIALRYVAGLDSTEIGSVTGTSASGVRSRLGRVLLRLRKDLDHG
jgi:RNA polymerase sigma-70 factor (ECF subfamily)